MRIDDIHTGLAGEISAALRRDGHSTLAAEIRAAEITHHQPVATFYTQYFFSGFSAHQIANECNLVVVNIPSLGLIKIHAVGNAPAMIEVLDRPDDNPDTISRCPSFCT